MNAMFMKRRCSITVHKARHVWIPMRANLYSQIDLYEQEHRFTDQASLKYHERDIRRKQREEKKKSCQCLLWVDNMIGWTGLSAKRCSSLTKGSPIWRDIVKHKTM